MLWLLRASICGLMLWTCSIARADATAFTHKQARALSPVHEGFTLRLKTFCMGPDENLWLCCSGLQRAPGGILILQPSGEFVRLVELDFVPTAINFTPDGTAAFVAGSGMIAKLSAQGEVLKAVAAPNLLTEEELKKKLQASFEKSRQDLAIVESENTERLTKQLDKLKSQIAAAEEKGDERALARAQSRLKTVQQQMEELQESFKQCSSEQIPPTDGLLTQAKEATAIAVTKEDIFASLASSVGNGYEVWRMNHDLGDACCIKDSIGGCCGQLDIQADGNDVLLAANTMFCVMRLDRDGKELASFGEKGDGGSGCGWGSCCNPMNIRVVGDELLAGESSVGHLKRYTKDGKYLGLVGTARIGGGCKHVALAVDKKRNWYFMMNQNNNNIAVLIPKEELPGESEEERLAREARDGLGKKLPGDWECTQEDLAQAVANDQSGLASLMLAGVRHLQFHPNGDLSFPSSSEADALASGILPLDDEAVDEGDLDEEANVGGSREVPLDSSSPVATEAPVMAQTWEAVRQENDQLEFLVRVSGAGNQSGTVSFVDAETITIQWRLGLLGEGNSQLLGTPMTYKRLPDQACAGGDQCEKCKK